jgi:hypothetical protein
MDNKQDRKIYNDIKNFIGQKHSIDPLKSKNAELHKTINSILESSQPRTKQPSAIESTTANRISQAISASQYANNKGTPQSKAFTKNIDRNLFGMIKEGIFDDVADAVNAAAPGMGTGLKTLSTVANVGMGLPTASNANQAAQGAGVGLSQIQSTSGAPAGAPPQSGASPSVFGAPPDSSGQFGGGNMDKGDYTTMVRQGQAINPKPGNDRTPEGRAANAAARAERNKQIAAGNIGLRAIQDEERAARAEERKRRYKEDEALEYEKETGKTLAKDGTVPADTAENRAALKAFRDQKQTNKMSSAFASDIENLSGKDPSELTAAETSKLAFARSVMSRDEKIASATETKVKDSINAQSGNVGQGSQAASRALGAIGGLIGGDAGAALSGAGAAMGEAGSSIVNQKADEIFGKTVGRSTEDLRTSTQDKVKQEGEAKAAEDEALRQRIKKEEADKRAKADQLRAREAEERANQRASFRAEQDAKRQKEIDAITDKLKDVPYR